MGYGYQVTNASTGAQVSSTPDPGYSWNGYTMDEATALGVANDAFVTNGGPLLKFSTNSSGGLVSSLSDSYAGQPSVAHGSVYVKDGSALVSLSESSLSKQWSWTPPDGDSLLGRDIVTDNLVITSTTADVYGINLYTGQTLWSVPVSGNLALSDNTLYVASSNGTVTAVAVPEPTTKAVAAGLLAALLLRRRSARTFSRADKAL